MRIQLLPSTFDAAQRATVEQRLTCFLIDECVCVDAGSIALGLDDTQRARVRDIILTHAHIDHIATLPIFIDDLAASLKEPIRVYATVDVIETLERDILNDTIYPRFSRLRGDHCFLMEYVPIAPYQHFKVEHLSFCAVPVNHTVPTVGLIISDSHRTIAFSGDTAETDEFWRVINDCKQMNAVIIETSFPNLMHELACLSKHLTPAMLASEMQKLAHHEADVLTVHLKASFRETLVDELMALGIPRLSVMEPGRVYEW
jgi:cAMP phosphodiesterase